jgi:beta-glucanase (GH16 family)
MWQRKSIIVKYAIRSFICLSLGLVILGGYLHLWSVQARASNNIPVTIAGSSQVNTPDSPSISKWKLIFDDEFSGPRLDGSKWNIENKTLGEYHNCCLNYGGQYYTPQALSFANGSLRITTEQQNKGTDAYTSGAITTENKFSFLYGRVDIRAKLSKTQGLWPAFWLLPNNTVQHGSFEIDMMEFRGSERNIIHMTNHWGTQQTGRDYTGDFDYSQDYHVFTLIWNAFTITWYVDGVQRFQTSQGVSNQSMYLIMNTTIGGHWGGIPNASTALPQYTDIDYVRVYKPLS